MARGSLHLGVSRENFAPRYIDHGPRNWRLGGEPPGSGGRSNGRAPGHLSSRSTRSHVSATDTALTIPDELKPVDGRFGCGPSKVRPEQLARLADTDAA